MRKKKKLTLKINIIIKERLSELKIRRMRHDPKLHKNMDHKLKTAYLRKQKEIKVRRDHVETLMSRR